MGSYDQPRQCIKKERHYFANKSPYSQSFGFSNSQVQMWELDHKESWVSKNRCFWTVLLEKTLETPCWRARRSHQSVVKEINPEYSLERSMLALKLQYFGHLMWRANSLENTLMLGKIEGRRRRGQQRMRCLDSITNSMDISWVNYERWWRTGKPVVLQSMGLQRIGHNLVTEQQQVGSSCMEQGAQLRTLTTLEG